MELDYDASIDPDACHYVDDDGSDSTYTISSLLHNAVGFREGAAHFYAARVWNDADPEGVFTWFGGDGRSLARLADPDPGGGRTFQRCVTPARPLATLCADNVTTNEDWLRFWWAWHTPTTGGPDDDDPRRLRADPGQRRPVQGQLPRPAGRRCGPARRRRRIRPWGSSGSRTGTVSRPARTRGASDRHRVDALDCGLTMVSRSDRATVEDPGGTCRRSRSDTSAKSTAMRSALDGIAEGTPSAANSRDDRQRGHAHRPRWPKRHAPPDDAKQPPPQRGHDVRTAPRRDARDRFARAKGPGHSIEGLPARRWIVPDTRNRPARSPPPPPLRLELRIVACSSA